MALPLSRILDFVPSFQRIAYTDLSLLDVALSPRPSSAAATALVNAVVSEGQQLREIGLLAGALDILLGRAADRFAASSFDRWAADPIGTFGEFFAAYAGWRSLFRSIDEVLATTAAATDPCAPSPCHERFRWRVRSLLPDGQQRANWFSSFMHRTLSSTLHSLAFRDDLSHRLSLEHRAAAEASSLRISETTNSEEQRLLAMHAGSFLQFVGEMSKHDECLAEARQVLAHALTELVEDTCAMHFDEGCVSLVLDWVHNIAVPFTEKVLAALGVSGNAVDFFDLERLACDCLADLRIRELFDIIVDYPDSQPAIDDLRQCLKSSRSKYQLLAETLKTSISSRLLQAGANTAAVISTFISTVRVVCFLDPTRLVLKSITEPVAEYIRQRPDAIRSIVMGMADESGDLYEELSLAPKGGSSAAAGLSQLLHEIPDALDWNPTPLEPGTVGFASASLDIDVLALLVSICGSPETFVSEYRSILASRLVQKSIDGDDECDAELRTVELMKIRFGEKNLKACEVMLKDFADSKRANAQIAPHLHQPLHQQMPLPEQGDANLAPVKSLIASQTFWPSFVFSSGGSLAVDDLKGFVPHPAVAALMNDYASRYSKLKAPRKLIWKTGVGSVSVSLELDSGRVLEVCLPPVAASALLHVVDGPPEGRSLQDLCRAMKITSTEGLVRRLGPLLSGKLAALSSSSMGSQAVAEESAVLVLTVDLMGDGGDAVEGGGSGSQMRLQRRGGTGMGGVAMPSSASSSQSAEIGLEGENGGVGGGAGSAPDEDGMVVFESFIVGMLTNLGPLQADRIQNMLKMYCFDPVYDRSLPELKRHLMKLVDQDVLDVDAGTFSLKPQ